MRRLRNLKENKMRSDHRTWNNSTPQDWPPWNKCTALLLLLFPHIRISEQLKTKGKERYQSLQREAVQVGLEVQELGSFYPQKPAGTS